MDDLEEVELDSGRKVKPKELSLDELCALVRAIELSHVAYASPGEKLPLCYIPLVREVYQRTKGHAPYSKRLETLRANAARQKGKPREQR